MMDFRIQQHRLQQLAVHLQGMKVLVVGLMLINLILACFAWYALIHQKTEITPFMGGSSYQKSDAVVDTQYLVLMSENFLYTRLNVTPETVISQHKRLLSFVDSSRYAAFKAQLDKEAMLIQKQHITSYFNLSSITTNHLTCIAKGILKRSVGTRELPDELITYTLNFNYHFGQLKIVSFTHEPGVKDHV